MDVPCAIESEDQPEKRRAPRLPVLRNAQMRTSSVGVVNGTILDLSTTGCRIATNGFYQVGTRVCLRIDGLQSWWGTIAWQNGTDVGIAFEQKLHAAVVEHISRATPH